MRGDRPGRKSGYDIADSDLLLMDMCHGIVVSSAIFGILVEHFSTHLHTLLES